MSRAADSRGWRSWLPRRVSLEQVAELAVAPAVRAPGRVREVEPGSRGRHSAGPYSGGPLQPYRTYVRCIGGRPRSDRARVEGSGGRVERTRTANGGDSGWFALVRSGSGTAKPSGGLTASARRAPRAMLEACPRSAP